MQSAKALSLFALVLHSLEILVLVVASHKFRNLLASLPISGYSAHSPRPALMEYTTTTTIMSAQKAMAANHKSGKNANMNGGGALEGAVLPPVRAIVPKITKIGRAHV